MLLLQHLPVDHAQPVSFVLREQQTRPLVHLVGTLVKLGQVSVMFAHPEDCAKGQQSRLFCAHKVASALLAQYKGGYAQTAAMGT